MSALSSTAQPYTSSTQPPKVHSLQTTVDFEHIIEIHSKLRSKLLKLTKSRATLHPPSPKHHLLPSQKITRIFKSAHDPKKLYSLQQYFQVTNFQFRKKFIVQLILKTIHSPSTPMILFIRTPTT